MTVLSSMPAARLPSRFVVGVSRRLGSLREHFFANRVKQPYFIVGCGRSGTTMLNALFDRHPSVANFPTESNELWHPRMYPWHESAIDSPPFFLDAREFTARSLAQQTADDHVTLRATFGAYQTLTRKPVFLAKTVMVAFMLDRLLETFPDARLIQVVRDGRAVALSWIVKEREKLTHPRYAPRYKFDEDQLLDIYARHWQDNILAMDEAVERLRLAKTGRYHEFTYEDLCADPTKQLTALAGFLGISPAPFLGDASAHIKNTNKKAASSITGDRLRALNETIAEGLRRKHYGPEIV